MKRIKSIEETNKEDAVRLLTEFAEQGFDSVILLGFNLKAHQFSIRSSRVHQRLELIGALREAEHHLINGGTL